MHKVVKICTLAVAYTLIVSPFMVSAQTDSINFSKIVDMEEVEIVGQKSPAIIEDLPRMVSIVSRVETQFAPAQSVSDLLRYASNIDIRQRGKCGIQSDISIRGGSFDHSMILLNGVIISDPQTGHFSLNLPMDVEAIDRIEILNGPAARVYGANAISGVINFVTRPSEINSAKITTSLSEYSYFSSSATLNLAIKNFRNLFFYSNSQSDGFTSNTDFKKQSIFYHGQIVSDEGIFDFQFGYNNLAFGANGFYTPRYPDQFEQNQMTLTSISYKTGKKNKIEPVIYWRRHRDRFELFRENSGWYRIENGITISNDTSQTQFDTIKWYSQHNHHINDVFGFNLNLTTHSKIGETSVGWHLRSESLLSNNIGFDREILIPVRGYDSTYYTKSDNRNIFEIYAEQTLNLKRVFIAAGALINWNSYMPDELHFLPGIDLRYDIIKHLSVIASYNHTLGLPTFTDLHYTDPNNEGNLKLKTYTQNSFEGGIRINYGANLTTTSCFYNSGKDVIDWVWFSDINRFRPINVGEYSARGIEMSITHNFARQFGLKFPIQSMRVNYTFIDMQKNIPGEITKYSNARNMLSAMLQLRIIRGLILAWNFSYLEREGSYLTYNFDLDAYQTNPYSSYFLVDTRLTYSLKRFTCFVEATNLLNEDYVDVGNILQPGRWLSAGIKIEISGF
jgi:iron complex outermembrane receptor protein